jgi:hypothetical protein
VRGSLVGDAFCNEDVYKGERTHSEAHEALQCMPLSADLPIEKWAGSSTDERLDLQNKSSNGLRFVRHPLREILERPTLRQIEEESIARYPS